MNMPLEQQKNFDALQETLVNKDFYRFVNEEVLPLTTLDREAFWDNFNRLMSDLAPRNRELCSIRGRIQAQIDAWHKTHKGKRFDTKAYKAFLKEIGYIVEEGAPFSIETTNVDEEIATIAGPQLVVPVKNARFALNAANARWGSLYDALYGTNVIPQSTGLKASSKYNTARGSRVIAYAKEFLDDAFPLQDGSHKDVISYMVYFQDLLATFADGSMSGLRENKQFVACDGPKSDPTSIVLKNNGLHIEIQIDRNGYIGAQDLAGVDDIQMESALTTIMDCEDSVAAVDAEDKIEVYRNWLGLMQGDLVSSFVKGGKQIKRRPNSDKIFTSKDGDSYRLHGRSLLLIRNVGHLMDSDLMTDSSGQELPEGIIDAVITTLIGSIDLQQKSTIRNSREGSIYIVKPKMHGPDEVAFTCELFSRVEDMLSLPRNTIKLGIMDEERRTTVNLKECIRIAKERIVFINTGFLDRTGDEIHTSMHAGAFLPKAEIKNQPWISAYENWNVDVGLACGFQGKAQIGKGMWAMPDEMEKMMNEKIGHPRAGANTAWVPSPTAATLHAMHYHHVDVLSIQEELKNREPAKLDDILTIPLLEDRESITQQDISKELENNIQSILGYMVRWIEQGVGCSKVPDINNVGLMEDRATLRISSQHIANWLLHGICNENQVLGIMERMAAVVDQQNVGIPGYIPMTPDTEQSTAFASAKELILKGTAQPSGYTEPVLHAYRRRVKSAKTSNTQQSLTETV